MKVIELVYRGVVHSKKNSKQIITNPRTRRPMIISGWNERRMEKEMVLSFVRQAADDRWEAREKRYCDGRTYTITIDIWQKDHHRRDLDNQATSILDALVQAAIIPDDSVKYVHRVIVNHRGVNREYPRAEIRVLED